MAFEVHHQQSTIDRFLKSPYQMWQTFIHRQITYLDIVYGSTNIIIFHEYCEARLDICEESNVLTYTYKANGITCDYGFITQLHLKEVTISNNLNIVNDL